MYPIRAEALDPPNVPTAHVSGTGLLADLLRGIVKAFMPLGIQLEIDTVPCLPTPIPPNYDRYVQIEAVDVKDVED
ncbi:hypothetical protein NQ317_019607 [Molorchus minor]|uniref:Dendritic cell-specific transmembrane protein-like domain-containing protein n=1 Tax=Molorchus minor TaxID=1323400 RepID=A0ABQ9J0R3_9CUCU|nr:hypothetical protein NQ317_019607 [Molorchus minor]